MPVLNGVIHVCGEPDVGKTTFALEAGLDPSRILFLDDDVKGKSTIDDLREMGIQFGEYVDIAAMFKNKTELDYHKLMAKYIQEIDGSKFDGIIWDTWTNFANGCHSYVEANPSQFRTKWSSMGTIKAGEMWQETRRLESGYINILSKKFKSVILITHLKNFYLNGKLVPGKQIPACSAAVERATRLRLWLRHNPDGRPVPIGLVLKRLNKKHLVGTTLRTVNLLPRKITPRPEEHSLWDSIWRYWDDPVGDRIPTPEETPDAFELSILDATLTEDQKMMFKVVAPTEDEGIEMVGDDPLARAQFLLDQGKPKPLVAKQLGITMLELNNLLLPQETTQNVD